MAMYKVTYILDDKRWERYVDDVISGAEAVDVCDINNAEMPKEAFVQVQLICE